MKESDLQFDRTRPPLSLLLAILRIEVGAFAKTGPAAYDLIDNRRLIATCAECGKSDDP